MTECVKGSGILRKSNSKEEKVRAYVRIMLTVLVAGLWVIGSVSAIAQESFNSGPKLPPRLAGSGAEYFFSFSYPNQVQRYRISCSDATTLKVQVADDGVAGDHWRAKAYIYDKYPTTKTTTSPGGVGVYSPVITMSNSGKIPLVVFVEVRYYHGLNDFPAAGSILFQTNGTCVPTVTDLGLSEF